MRQPILQTVYNKICRQALTNNDLTEVKSKPSISGENFYYRVVNMNSETLKLIFNPFVSEREERIFKDEVYCYGIRKEVSPAVLYRKHLKSPFNFLLSDEMLEDIHRLIVWASNSMPLEVREKMVGLLKNIALMILI